MKKFYLLVAAICGIVSLSYSAYAQNPPNSLNSINSTNSINSLNSTNSPSSEVDLLKRRIDEVENQNRLLMQMVTELKARLDASSQPELNHTNAPARVAVQPPTPVTKQPAAQSEQADKNQTVRWSDIIGEGNKVKLYGFLRLDLDFDSQHPNSPQAPLFITSPDVRANATTNGDFSMHPRLMRIGVDFSGPRIDTLGGAKLSGKLETDFENGGSESRQIIRIRHAYLRLDSKDFSLLAGQTWDIVSPLFPTVNTDTLQWNAGNVGDRRPQLRAAYEPKAGRGKLSFMGGIGLTGAVDAADLDNNGFRDGEESVRPDVQGRIGYSYPIGKDRSVSFGFSGFYGYQKTARLVAGRTEFRSQLLNADFTLPIASIFALRGEGWWGRNMSDTRGGAGQGINLLTGREIRGRGGWTEANIKVSRYLSLNPGFSTDDPVDQDVPNGGRTRNRAFYFANRITPGGNFVIGADYLRWRTDYKGFQRGIDNRFNIFLQYGF